MNLDRRESPGLSLEKKRTRPEMPLVPEVTYLRLPPAPWNLFSAHFPVHYWGPHTNLYKYRSDIRRLGYANKGCGEAISNAEYSSRVLGGAPNCEGEGKRATRKGLTSGSESQLGVGGRAWKGKVEREW